MTWFIDRRLNGKNKSMVNRQRFLRRYKAQIKQSISEAINKRSVTDVDSGESVSIPTEDISEPMFHQGRGGLRHRVHPGNDHFVQNDRIERPCWKRNVCAKKLQNYVPKLNASLLLTPSIYVTRTTRSGPIPPARQ